MLLSLTLLCSTAALRGDFNLEDKIRTVNLQSLVMESEGGKEAVGELQKMSASLEAEAKQIMAELKHIEDEQQRIRGDIVKQKAVASPQAQADSEKKIRDLEYKKGELNAKLQRIVQDGRNDLQMEEMRLMQPLYADLVQVVSDWAKEKNLYIVLDESSGRVIYKKVGLDATADVMKLANKKHEQKTTLAKSKAVAAPKPATKAA